MATKKCPKCGEENPAEAVMCWACYTPLAGGAAAATGGGLVAPRGGAAAVTPAATAAREDEEKVGTDPKVFLVAGLLFGAILIGGFTTGLFGSLMGGGDPPTTVDPAGNMVTTPEMPVPPTNPGAVGAIVVPDTPAGGVAPAAVPKQYEVIAPPNSKYPVGTLGIYATQPNISAAQAGRLAQFARQQFAPTGKWARMQVVVFNNRDAAKVFQKYQARRQNAALTLGDYQQMASDDVWSSVPAYLESQGNNERVVSPSRNPKNWWG